MSLSPRPEPNLKFSRAILIRDAYVAQCPGVLMVQNDATKNDIAINLMESEILQSALPPLSEGWRAIAILLSPEDAFRLGESLIKLAQEQGA